MCKRWLERQFFIHIKAISKTLTLILDENMKMSNYDEIVKKQSKNKFSTNKEPKISVYDYLVRIQTYSHIEKNTLIISLIYILQLRLQRCRRY